MKDNGYDIATYLKLPSNPVTWKVVGLGKAQIGGHYVG